MRDFALIMESRGHDHPVISWRHGFPGPMTFIPTEFAAIRSAWRREGLPDDLYDPEAQQRRVIEPEDRFGVVRRVISF